MTRFLILLFALKYSQSIAQHHTELMIKNRIDHIEFLAREPMVRQHPNGTLFVTGYRNSSDSPQLWKSGDMGKTWTLVNVGTPMDGAIGNSDVDLYIDGKGTIFLLSMTYTQLPEKLENVDFSTLKGERITIGSSNDEGKSWYWQTISEQDYDDRPWITGTSDGTLHIIWNNTMGIHHAISKDEGQTWQKRPDISPKGGSSFLANGPNGQLAVRVAPLSASAHKMDEGFDLIQLSADYGETWNSVEIPGTRTWTQNLSGVPRWVEPLAWDSKDNLYALWSEGNDLKLGATTDYGKTWQEHNIISSRDTIYFPYMEMNHDTILCTWVSGFKNDIRHNAAILTLENGKANLNPLEPKKLDIWSRFQIGAYERSTGGEYFPIIPLQNGNFGMVTPLQNSKAGREGFTWWELVLNEF